MLNTLDPATLRDLKALIRGGADGADGRGKQLGRAIETLDPALSQVDGLEQEVLRDEDTFARFLVESADVCHAVALAARAARAAGAPRPRDARRARRARRRARLAAAPRAATRCGRRTRRS